MKINPPDELSKSAYPEKIKKSEKAVEKDFGRILKETIENTSKVNVEDQKPPIIDSITKIQYHTFSPAEKIPMIDHVEKLLDILDEYQQKLGDPQFTLKDIHPLINKMEVEKERLIPVLNSLPYGDELKDILNHALITSTVEIIKYNRGDYLNQ